jgi:ATP-dependent phosphofructokinase / diphosphate-dependent phosphofructokinase
LTQHESRAVVLGHLLRGGSPTALDRLLGLSFGAAAVKALDGGMNSVMVVLDPPQISYVPLRHILERQKSVPRDGYGVLTARALGIALGD